jgi:hypothetical protein
MTSTNNSIDLTNIEDVFYKIIKTNIFADPTSTFNTWFAQNDAQNIGAINDAITALFVNKSSDQGYPTWDQFINYIAQNHGQAVANSVTQSFIKGYRFALFTDPGVPATILINSPPRQDWDFLNQNGIVTAQDIQNQFKAAFTYLSKNFPTELNGQPLPDHITPEQFKDVFLNFTARSVLMQTKSLNNLPPAQTVFKNQQLVASYQEIYNNYYPNIGLTDQERTALFQQILGSFVQQQVSQKGFFIPTQSFQDWGTFLEQSSGARIFGKDTSLHSIGSEKVLILDRIYRLLAMMVDTLQETAAVQSDRLLLYTDWQNAYTKQISTIPVYAAGQDNYPGSIGGEDGTTFRSDINNLSATYQEKLTAERQVISDEAKSQQTAITQTTDAVTQQSNFASSILEQLSTLLSAIYR